MNADDYALNPLFENLDTLIARIEEGKALGALAAHITWMVDQGGDLEGYVARHGKIGAKIYAADEEQGMRLCAAYERRRKRTRMLATS